MGALTGAVAKWAEAHFKDPKHETDPTGQRSSFRFPLQDETIDVSVYVDSDDVDSVLSVYTYLSFPIPSERQAEVQRLIGLLNPNMRVGCFELTAKPMVRFRTAFFLEGTTPSSETIDSQVKVALRMAASITPMLTAIVFTGVTAETAMEVTDDEETEGEQKTAPGEEWIERDRVVRNWSSFTGVAPIQKWASSLTRKVEKPIPGLAAKGVLFIGNSADTCEEVARLAAKEAGQRFAFIPREQVQDLTPTMLTSLTRLAPVMIYLQVGEWASSPDHPGFDKEGQQRTRDFQKLLLKAIELTDPAHRVVFATSAGSVRRLSGVLTNVGAFDLAFAVPEPSPTAGGELFMDLIGRERCAPSMLSAPAKVGKALALAFSSRDARELAALHLKRAAVREERKVEFIDLIELYTREFVEAAPLAQVAEPLRQAVAVHEAGHAAMAVLDSGGANVPDFSTIIPSIDSRGVVVSSLAHLHDANERQTYQDFRHSVRVSLAGRAAEELVFGPAHIGNGASSDLENATRTAQRAFGEWGYAPGMDGADASAKNLAVIVGTPSPGELEHLVTNTRRFLEEEYRAVLEMLRKHRPFLDAVRDRLLVDPVVDRSELSEICAAQGVPVQA